ncbi:hypothetical protein B0H16DRAFT_1879847 [Mycena metata]|uniref:Protein kinase domain-containing protein n=1 Tax=Mycena metata TaxID=1033252 RepID=A0AAD7K081_9AGAR|nr:hypothetical protein B0H16DRAFT_1879847 [Mycena metata]
MDTETHSDDESISAPSPEEPVFTSGGMFTGSQHFTIAGGIFNNLAAPAAPAGFRMLPMGDIDLQREVMAPTESGGVVELRREGNRVRRVYSAKVSGRNSNVTVAVYQGEGAEEAWRRDIEMYMSVRHPNIIQTWAGASYGNVHATVFHGDLVPLKAFMDHQSPVMTVHLYAVHRQGSGSGWQITYNHWDCYRAEDVFHTRTILDLVFSHFYYAQAWLSQANYIFRRLRITSDLEDYKLLDRIYFSLRIGDAGRDPPVGFLFLCPPEDFRNKHTSLRWPNRPAYSSLDPEGLEALSTEEAERLGFPSFQPTTEVVEKSWDASVYSGLHEFHQAKGFDPDSQEVALHLGEPLFRLSSDVESQFTHVDDWFDERPDEEGMNEAHEDEESSSTNHDAHEEDGERLFCNSDWTESATEGDGEVDPQPEACAPPRDASREVHQEPNGCNSSSTDQEMPNERATGGGFTHRFFWRLQQGLMTETGNVDTDPISPFLI